MEFMFLIVSRKGSQATPTTMAEMGRFAGELAQQGKLRAGAPLESEAAGVRIRVRDGKTTVTDGPFAESKEIVAGYFIVDAADRAEAIALAKRCPHVASGPIEIRTLPDRVVTGGEGTNFMFLLWMDTPFNDPDGSKYREMVGYDEALKREGPYRECSQLGQQPPGARVETRGGKTIVTDGPFVETKEIAGGYFIVAAENRSRAIEIAKRCPHATWGTVEVRQVVNVA